MPGLPGPGQQQPPDHRCAGNPVESLAPVPSAAQLEVYLTGTASRASASVSPAWDSDRRLYNVPQALWHGRPPPQAAVVPGLATVLEADVPMK